jgi:hypothetical protein
MGKTATRSIAQNKLALPTAVGIAQTMFCAGISLVLFYCHIFLRSEEIREVNCSIDSMK